MSFSISLLHFFNISLIVKQYFSLFIILRIEKNVNDILEGIYKGDTDQARVTADLEKTPGIGHNLSSHLEDLKSQMLKAAENLEFEEAAKLRDQIQKLEKAELEIKKDPFAR